MGISIYEDSAQKLDTITKIDMIEFYEICKREFSKEDFQPLDIDSVWDEFQDVL